jgi:hypothetical protein
MALFTFMTQRMMHALKLLVDDGFVLVDVPMLVALQRWRTSIIWRLTT